MSINQIDVIDVISITPEDDIQLTISDHHLWDNDEHLLLLQDKLNTYLQFIESGQIFQSYPAAKNRIIIISIRMKYEPNESSLVFLNQCKEIVTSAGLRFEWQTIKTTNTTK